jgi:hypothetical protein
VYVAVVNSNLHPDPKRWQSSDETVQVRRPEAAANLYRYNGRIGNRDVTLVIPVEFLNRIVERLTLECKVPIGPRKLSGYVLRKEATYGD